MSQSKREAGSGQSGAAVVGGATAPSRLVALAVVVAGRADAAGVDAGDTCSRGVEAVHATPAPGSTTSAAAVQASAATSRRLSRRTGRVIGVSCLLLGRPGARPIRRDTVGPRRDAPHAAGRSHWAAVNASW